MHRYMTASPGCWRIYTELTAGNLPAGPMSDLVVDAYAVTHPGVLGPQSTPSVWIHLTTLCFILERGWPVSRAVRLRTVAADAFDGWPWLERPDRMGDVTAVDVAAAVARGELDLAGELTAAWVGDAWNAWSVHHAAVRARADELSHAAWLTGCPFRTMNATIAPSWHQMSSAPARQPRGSARRHGPSSAGSPPVRYRHAALAVDGVSRLSR